jgi:hypothetical protein
MGGTVTSQRLDTCEIVWWSGYVKGRFQAYAPSSTQTPRLVAESPAIRWRSVSAPGPTEAAVEALETLTRRLADDGWVVVDRSGETWFGMVLSRHADAGSAPSPDDRHDFRGDDGRGARGDLPILAPARRELEPRPRMLLVAYSAAAVVAAGILFAAFGSLSGALVAIPAAAVLLAIAEGVLLSRRRLRNPAAGSRV